MKRTLSIVLLFNLLYSMIGYYLNFSIEQYWNKVSVQRQIFQKMPHGGLTVIKVNSANAGKIDWIEKNAEFRYGDNMYDIVLIKKVNNTTIYYCLNDSREELLIQQFEKLVQQQTDHNRSRAPQHKPVFHYLPPSEQVRIPTYIALCENHEVPLSVYGIRLDTLTPPPKVFFS